MEELKYCPQCGNPTLLWNYINKWSCSNCSFILFHNTAAAVAVVIRCGEEILLTKRNQDPGKGKLDLAGGFVDPNETAEETCKRELMEEMNIEIDISQLKIISTQPNIYHYKGIDYNTLDIFYEYEVSEKFDAYLDLNEISNIIWIPTSEINLEDIAFESQKRFFEAYLKR